MLFAELANLDVTLMPFRNYGVSIMVDISENIECIECSTLKEKQILNGVCVCIIVVVVQYRFSKHEYNI